MKRKRGEGRRDGGRGRMIDRGKGRERCVKDVRMIEKSNKEWENGWDGVID